MNGPIGDERASRLPLWCGRYVEAYLTEFDGFYSAGDAGIVDEDGGISREISP